MDESNPKPNQARVWYPLLVGLLIFVGGTWFWIENAIVLHNVPSFLWAFSIAFLGTTAMRQLASPRTDYLGLVTPILALGSTLSALYLIRMSIIRDNYAAMGRAVPEWWTSSEVFRDIITSGGTGRGILELSALLMASIAGLTCSAALVGRGRP